MSKKGVVIFSPSIFSLYTLCVSKILLDNDIKISSIIILNLVNKKRLKSEFKRDGSRLIKKIWKKLFLREKAYKSSENNIVKLKNELKIRESNIVKFAKNNNINISFVNNFNSNKIENSLKILKPEVGVFTGGGLIRKKIIECFDIGIINCHMGLLPDYRGMDVVEWPILNKEFNQIGLTTHLIDPGVDTGDIIKLKKYNLNNSNNDISIIRDEFEPIMCKMITRDTKLLLSKNYNAQNQSFFSGKQYYIMHEELKKIAEKFLKDHR
jgi:methionyl-tRNA formyltransferase